MDRRYVFTITPTAPLSPRIAIAGSRANATGILDLSFQASEAPAATQCLRELQRQTSGKGFGVLLDRDAEAWLDALRGYAGLRTVILAQDAWRANPGLAATTRELNTQLWLQLTTLEAADGDDGFLSLEPDGVVLKGHEAGGAIGHETSFVLLQRWQRRFGEDSPLPVVVQGGIGPHSATACVAGGADGVALDAQLLLTRESPLEATHRQWLTAADGSESRVVGQELGWPIRFMAPPRCGALEKLQASADRVRASGGVRADWLEAVAAAIDAGALPWGQDAGLASLLAQPSRTVGGVLESLDQKIQEGLKAAAEHQPLAPGAPLAESHGTQYPLMQGPMTRVSDVAPFADAVADAGALPFLALALLRGPQVEELLQETKERLENRSWGVGLLGFLPPEIRKEQMEAVSLHRPPFAVIAGGRPDQARVLEDQGIPTYLHVPSPGLLKMFLKDGARRFIFEGRECGGHVGPRSSFVLWETMCQLLQRHLSTPKGRADAKDLHIVFAGGIHDHLSAAMVAAMAAPLAAAGCKIGGLMGTAYLFTKEAVESGAIVSKFQEQALSTTKTVLLETGPGHAVRCIPTPYYDVFESEKRRLMDEGKSHEEIVKALEWMNIGRLRVASKGLDRVDDGAGRRLAEVSEQEQHDRGMYMIGQVAVMHDNVVTMRELHREVCEGARQRIEAVQPDPPAAPAASPCDIAIVGMSSFYPGSVGLQEYWENILNNVYAVTEVPEGHWDWRLFYDADPLAPDRIASKWGGFLKDVVFDPFEYGITPKSIPSIEPLQLLLLESVKRAIADAGYAEREFDREHTCAILGIGGGGSPLGVMYGLRSSLPLLNTIEGLPTTGEEVIRLAGDQLPEWTEDSFPGFLLNVAVGRTANRFNFGGSNYAVDAACASSLAAVHACIRELEQGTANFAVAMGADTVNTPYSFMAFSKTHALSSRGRCRPFDEEADGIVLSEGIGAVILKRLEDAERDGDDIYAVIRGIGSSSDGKDKGLTAPNAAGQLRALRRAYRKAGISPDKVELIEAHGTGTVVGDRTEATSLTSVMHEAGAANQSCALGSVKSMIGHSKCAAGIAGLIKTAMALHHRTLPPTLVETPNVQANFSASALYLNTETRPWIHDTRSPRVAGVSAFGFGGTNVHVVMEEYTDNYLEKPGPSLRTWPTELLVWRNADPGKLRQSVETALQKLKAGAKPELTQWAASLWKACPRDPALPTLAVVAESLEDAEAKLESALAAMEKQDSPSDAVQDPRGIFYAAAPGDRRGQVAMLFPGQGSQYVNMLANAAINFAEVREALDQACTDLHDAWDRPLSRWIYAPSSFSDEERQRHEAALAATDVAQPAIGAASLGMLRLLRGLGVEADCYAGHSYGEWTALCAAGALDEASLLRLSLRRGQLMKQAAADGEGGGMIAISAAADKVAALVDSLDGVWLANLNSPVQTVVSGTEQGLAALADAAKQQKLKSRRLPVACGFHSPLVEAAAAPLAEELRGASWHPPAAPVYSNVTAAPYSDNVGAIQEQLSGHLRSSVRFQEQIQAMYDAGVRTFIEVGPGQVLTGLAGRILGEQPHLAVASDSKSRPATTQLMHLLGQLLTHGVEVSLDDLYWRRDVTTFDPNKLEKQTGEKEHPLSAWVINGTRNRPLNAPEPRLLGAVNRPRSEKEERDAADAKGSQRVPATASKSAKKSTTTSAARSTKKSAPVGNSTSQSTTRSSTTEAAAAPSPAAKPPVAARPPQQATAATTSSSPRATETQAGMKKKESPSTRVSAHQPPTDDAAQVMLGFQDVMARFLETQRTVMTSYLGGVPAEALDSPSQPARALPSPAPQASPAQAPGAEAPAKTDPAHPAPAPTTPNNNGHAGSNGSVHNAVETVTSKADKADGPETPQAETTSTEAAAAPASPDTASAASEAPDPARAAGAGNGPEKSLEELSDDLLDLVSERTGYPKEMLDWDLDLEADLGIDSIKRVEILGGLAESLGEAPPEDGEYEGQLELEKLTAIRTLRGIVDYLEETLFSDASASASPGASAESAVGGEEPGNDEVQRGLVELVETPTNGGAPMIPRGAILVTDDGQGLARELTDRMTDFGQRVVLLKDRPGNGEVQWEGDVCSADLSCPDSVKQLLDAARERYNLLAGLLHTAPVSTGDDASARVRDTQTLYVLSRELLGDLKQASQQGGAFVLVCSSLDGCLGFGESPLSSVAAACHGGLHGFTKSLVHELPEALVRVVDFEPHGSPADQAEKLLAELGDADGPAEVGWRGGKRRTWAPIGQPTDNTTPADTLADGSVILVTGGARGITAAISAEIARRCQPHLILVGRSALPEAEDASTAELTEPADLKRAIMATLQQAGEAVKPAQVEARYNKLVRDREVLQNLQTLREAGAEVEYHSVDVRDRAALQALIDDVVARKGRIDGVLHGAGVIEDKLIRDKTLESYDRVIGTKIDGALSLAELLDPEQLKFCVFFSSIAGRYGNKGQADYAAANEMLSKLAIDLDRRWPGRVVAVDWGPWGGVGMVADLEKHMTARGVTLITPEVGAAFLVDELLYGEKGDSEVIIAGGASNLHSPSPATA